VSHRLTVCSGFTDAKLSVINYYVLILDPGCQACDTTYNTDGHYLSSLQFHYDYCNYLYFSDVCQTLWIVSQRRHGSCTSKWRHRVNHSAYYKLLQMTATRC